MDLSSIYIDHYRTQKEQYTITPYNIGFQQGVDDLMDSIAAEFSETIYERNSKKMNQLYLLAGRYYWVVLCDNMVVGTVGLAVIANQVAVLKGMMLHKDHRGKDKRLSQRMLAIAEDEAIEKGALQMYLGTMTQMERAQRFYEQHGYRLIAEEQLPPDFPANPVDKIFYFKELEN